MKTNKKNGVPLLADLISPGGASLGRSNIPGGLKRFGVPPPCYLPISFNLLSKYIHFFVLFSIISIFSFIFPVFCIFY